MSASGPFHIDDEQSYAESDSCLLEKAGSGNWALVELRIGFICKMVRIRLPVFIVTVIGN